VIFGTRDYPKSESLCGRVCGLCGGNYWLCNRDQRGLLVLIETRADAAHRETVTDETIAVGAPAGTFFDFSAIHLVTTATFATLARAYPQGRFEWRRFRPNIIAQSDAPGFPENDWVGRRISVGGEVTLEVLIPCPRCVMTTLAQGDLPLDSGILRTAAQQNNVMIAPLRQAMPSVGVYAKVLTGGVVRRGDQVRIVS
jgi:uncharacterized protein